MVQDLTEKSLLYFFKDIRPTSKRFLPKQGHGRIPGGVVAVHQPSPIAPEIEQSPDTFTQCPIQVGHRCIDCDDQVKCIHKSGSGGEVAYRTL